MAGINTGDKLQRLTGTERLGGHRDSEYLGAEDIDNGIEPILTIEGIWWGAVTTARGKENKDVISFVEETTKGIFKVRPLICNSTNRKTLKKLFGAATSDTLTGKRIQLYIDHNVRDPENGGKTDGIRIRNFVPKDTAIKCELCGKNIESAYGMTPEALAGYTFSKYGKKVCADCAKKLADEAKANEVSPEVQDDGINEG